MTIALAATMLVSASAPSFAVAPWCKPRVLTTAHGSHNVAPWLVIGCAGGIILAAFAANHRDGRELTAEEAWSCGTLFLFSRPRQG
jgi:hypothetical protein